MYKLILGPIQRIHQNLLSHNIDQHESISSRMLMARLSTVRGGGGITELAPVAWGMGVHWGRELYCDIQVEQL